MKRPNLFIVGGQKCGTSALAHFLSQHPDICLANGKEAHVFDHPEIDPANVQQLDQGYAPFFQHGNMEKFYCDATPIYGYWRTLLPHIAAYSPGAKVIFMVRDPVERAVSQYMMESRRGVETLPMWQAFWSESSRLKPYTSMSQSISSPLGLSSQDFNSQHLAAQAWSSPSRWASYVDRGRFQQQITTIQTCFPEPNVLIIHNDDLRHSHQDTLNKVYKFLDISDHDVEPKDVFSGQYQATGFFNKVARVYAQWKLRDEIHFVRQFRSNLILK